MHFHVVLLGCIVIVTNSLNAQTMRLDMPERIVSEPYSTKGPLLGQGSFINGQSYTFQITWEQLFKGGVRWQVDQAEPPVLPNAAVAKALKALKVFGGSPEPWRVRKVELPQAFTGTAARSYFT